MVWWGFKPLWDYLISINMFQYNIHGSDRRRKLRLLLRRNLEWHFQCIYDLFRMENGKAVEHWDVIQPVPTTGLANNNGMFGGF